MSQQYISDHNGTTQGEIPVWCAKWVVTPSKPRGVLLAGDSDGQISLWKAPELEPFRVLSPRHSLGIQAIDSSYDGKFAVSSSLDSVLCRWDIDGEKLEAKKALDQAQCFALAVRPFVSSSSSLPSLVTAGANATVRFLSASVDGTLNFGDELGAVNTQRRFAMKLAYNSSGSMVAMSTDTGEVSVIDTETMAIAHSFSAHATAVRSLLFTSSKSSTSSLLLTGGDDGQVNAFDIRAPSSEGKAEGQNSTFRKGGGGHVAMFKGKDGARISSMDVRGDGKMLAVGSSDGSISLYDLSHFSSSTSPSPISIYPSQHRDVSSLAWRPILDTEISSIDGSMSGGGAWASFGEEGGIKWWRGTGGR